MPTFIDLSHPLEDGQLTFSSDSPVHLTKQRTLNSGGYNLTNITLSSHQGTHLDAPSHFLADGATVDAIPLERFFGPAELIDLAPGKMLPPLAPLSVEMFRPHEAAFQPGAKVIYRTGWDRMFGQPEFFSHGPSLTLEATRWIAERRIGLLGMDPPTPTSIETDTAECHQILLVKGVEIVVVEGLANLDQLPRRFTFVGFPLKLLGCDGSPIRAAAYVD